MYFSSLSILTAVRCSLKLLLSGCTTAGERDLKGIPVFSPSLFFSNLPPREKVSIARDLKLVSLDRQTLEAPVRLYSHYGRPADALCGRGRLFSLLNGCLCSHRRRMESMR